MKLFGRRIDFRVNHRDLDLNCDARYHVERYLEKNGIYLEMFEYKYEDIKDLVRHCRGSRDIECANDERIPLMRVGSKDDAGWEMSGDSTRASSRLPASGSVESSSQQALNLEPLITCQLLPSTRLEDSLPPRHRTQSIPIPSPTSARRRQSIMEDEHELQSLCRLQTPLPIMDYGTTPETLYSETDIATPESRMDGHVPTSTKDMDEENE